MSDSPANVSPGANVAVLGAGLQGGCVALAARRLGLCVDLFDQHPLPMMGASLHNEGKVHLGYVYAKDPDGATHELMVRGSLSFATDLRELTGIRPSQYLSEGRFTYAVPSDSQLGAGEIALHFERVQALIRASAGDHAEAYLGGDARSGLRRIDLAHAECPIDADTVLEAWHTPERAVDTERLAQALRERLMADPGVRFLREREVMGVDWQGDRPLIESRGADGTHRRAYAAAVNCLWEGRLPIDKSAGLAAERPCLHRYKAYLRFRAQPMSEQQLPSTTLVLGPYGDLVNYGGGDYYLSWYPSYRLGETLAPDGRMLHDLVRRVDVAKMLATGLREMGRFLPALRGLQPEPGSVRLGGGVISAWGSSDIDDQQSELHSRAQIGPEQRGRYISVNTGKFTTAPMFARDVQRRLAEMFDRAGQAALP